MNDRLPFPLIGPRARAKVAFGAFLVVPAVEAERPVSASKKRQTASRHQPVLHQLPDIAIFYIYDRKNAKFIPHALANRGAESAPPLDQKTKMVDELDCNTAGSGAVGCSIRATLMGGQTIGLVALPRPPSARSLSKCGKSSRKLLTALLLAALQTKS